jgi:hypothetical protein
MKRYIPCSFLFVAYQILGLLGKDLAQIELTQVFRPQIILISFMLFLILVVQHLLKDGHHTSFVVLVFRALFYGCGYLKQITTVIAPGIHRTIVSLTLAAFETLLVLVIVNKKV